MRWLIFAAMEVGGAALAYAAWRLSDGNVPLDSPRGLVERLSNLCWYVGGCAVGGGFLFAMLLLLYHPTP
jgi:hypothetical protein